MTHTKIVCTLGPSTRSKEAIRNLIVAGMNVARLNFSHGTHEEHQELIQWVKEARDEEQLPVAIMLDTKGPEIRLGEIESGAVSLTKGGQWDLLENQVLGSKKCVSIKPGKVLKGLSIGDCLLFDDGYICSRVIEKIEGGVRVKIENEGVLKGGKGVNIPNVDLDLPAMTDQDIDDIRFGCQQGIDLIAASFIRCPEHVLLIKHLLKEEGASSILLFAKIENYLGVQNFDQIVQVADGIMIARGDLGVEVPISQVPRLQKMMIRKCAAAGKPSITATQMLESMMTRPRPTRAEVSDVANAIYDSTSAVMLSGETAAGNYPIETVEVMKSIIEEAEADFDYRTFFGLHGLQTYHDVPSAVSLASVKIAYSSHAKAIFAFTQSGSTARLLSRLRPEMPIIAMTPDEKSYHQLSSNWGVFPFRSNDCQTAEDAFARISEFALEKGYVTEGDLVVVTSGSPFGIEGTTNTIIVENIGNVLVRCHRGVGERVYGKVIFVYSVDLTKSYQVQDQLMVITSCDNSYEPLIKEAKGVILQNHLDDMKSEKALLRLAKKYQKPALVRADGATQVLKEEQLVTLDPQKALIYKGVVLS